jgi:hypothetical protein
MASKFTIKAGHYMAQLSVARVIVGAAVPVLTNSDRRERKRRRRLGKPPPYRERVGELAGHHGHVISSLKQWR